MNDFFIKNIADINVVHKHEHANYEHYKKTLIPIRDANQCRAAYYEIPPGKAAYPYHYHLMNEELFYILKGQGRLTTPSGDFQVSPGDFLFFPANEKGAHILFNTSETDTLAYLDFGSNNPIDVSFYPNTNKMGVWGKNVNRTYKVDDNIDYYDGESDS